MPDNNKANMELDFEAEKDNEVPLSAYSGEDQEASPLAPEPGIEIDDVATKPNPPGIPPEIPFWDLSELDQELLKAQMESDQKNPLDLSPAEQKKIVEVIEFAARIASDTNNEVFGAKYLASVVCSSGIHHDHPFTQWVMKNEETEKGTVSELIQAAYDSGIKVLRSPIILGSKYFPEELDRIYGEERARGMAQEQAEELERMYGDNGDNEPTARTQPSTGNATPDASAQLNGMSTSESTDNAATMHPKISQTDPQAPKPHAVQHINDPFGIGSLLRKITPDVTKPFTISRSNLLDSHAINLENTTAKLESTLSNIASLQAKDTLTTSETKAYRSNIKEAKKYMKSITQTTKACGQLVSRETVPRSSANFKKVAENSRNKINAAMEAVSPDQKETKKLHEMAAAITDAIMSAINSLLNKLGYKRGSSPTPPSPSTAS